MTIPPLAFFCIAALAPFPDQLHSRRIPASPALLDALPATRDPCLWATLAQLVHPLPPHLHEFDLPLSHPALPLLQNIPDSPDFTLVTLVALPHCAHLRDDNVSRLSALRRLVALDLRGCAISSYALTVLARGLALSSSDDTGSGVWGLRLLSLHGCPNIDNDALSVLHKFPLLSAVDVRFTRCTPTAVDMHLSALGFRSSDNSSLFYPAPLSVALCALEKVALTAPDPISLYSCPSQSVFRLHINELDHLPCRPKEVVPAAGSSSRHSTIRTISSAEDIVVFAPPLRKSGKTGSSPIASASSPTHPTPTSNVTSFYENAPVRNRHSRQGILPLSAQAVRSSEGGKLDPLAIARPPPPWKILDNYTTRAPPFTEARPQSSSDTTGNTRRSEPIARWSGQSLNKPLKVDRARLHRRDSDAVADMVHKFTSKRAKIESEFAKARADVCVKSRNPFARSAVVQSTSVSDRPVHESWKEVKSGTQLRVSHSLPCKTRSDIERAVKPLKPITTLKPPILAKGLLPSSSQHSSRTKTELKQTRLVFTGEEGS